MPTGQLSGVLRQIRRAALLQEDGDLADGQLLDHFLAHHDETAFEALVRRHGPMVMGVCRRVLRNTHDAEDAFQATFLVLVRKAASIVPREMVGNWLYGVAYRTALGAKTACARRRAKEREMPRHEAIEEDIWGKLRPLLDHELSHLPDKYRVPIVLCDLESKSRKEAARQLGWSEGTLSGRLARARLLLAKRLSARGLTLSGGTLAAALGGTTAVASVPLPLLMSTVKAATLLASGRATVAGVVSIKVAVLMQGVLRAMVMTKVKLATVWLLAAGIAGGGIGLICYPTRLDAQASPKQDIRQVSSSINEKPLPIPLASRPADKNSNASGKSTRRIESGDTLLIKLKEPMKDLPTSFLGGHTVGANGAIGVGEATPLFVQGQTLDQVKELLAHLLKSRSETSLLVNEINKNLEIELVLAQNETDKRRFHVQFTAVTIERLPENSGMREKHVIVASPEMLILCGQEATIGIDQKVVPVPFRKSRITEFRANGLTASVRISDLPDGRLRLETKIEQSQIERIEEDNTRVLTKGVRAVECLKLGDVVKIELKNDKNEIRDYFVLSVTQMETDSKHQPALVNEVVPARIGEIKIAGTVKIPSRVILQAAHLFPGAILRDTDVLRAEKNLARLGFFQVNAEKNIRPRIAILEAEDHSGFKDILIRVKER